MLLLRCIQCSLYQVGDSIYMHCKIEDRGVLFNHPRGTRKGTNEMQYAIVSYTRYTRAYYH